MDVLLVDDSRVMRQVVRRTLRQAGYDLGQVVEAENGKDALQKLAGWKPQLVLADWNMPEMSGIELLEALRKGGNAVPFAFVTSESTSAMRERALASGALTLLTKPFTAEEFRKGLTVAGFKPTSGIASAGDAALRVGAFDDKTMGSLLTRLVGQNVQVVNGQKIVPSPAPLVGITWIDAAGKVQYGGLVELTIAAALGTVMAMRPAGMVKEVMASRVFPESLQGDVREVFNVLSRVFNDAGSTHVKLAQITFPPAAPPYGAISLDSHAAGRRDFQVTVPNFGTGKISLFSGAPTFIVPE